MAKYLGDKVEARTTTIGLTDSDGDTSVGDAVAVASGDATPADTEAHDGAVGVRARGEMSASNIPTVISGVVIATVASGLTAGTYVGAGNATDGTTGALASGGDRGVLLSDEGGSYKGSALETGEAAVYLF